MAFNTQEQEIIKYGIANGKSRQEVEQAISNFRSGVVPKPKVDTQQTAQPSLGEKLQGVAQQTGNEILDVAHRVASGETGLTSAALQTGASVTNAGMGAVGSAITSIPGATEAIQTVAKPISSGLEAVNKWISDNPSVQKAVTNETSNAIADFLDKHPDISRDAKAVNDIANAVLAVKGTVKTVSNIANKIPTITDSVLSTSKTIDGIPVATLADEALHSGMQLKNDIQLSIAKKNVSPQLESSAGRLMSDTAQNVENPVVAYDKYLEQSKKSLGDIKVDAPISTVGGKIGDAFMKVVKQRQQVGATIGDELKSVGKLKVSVVEPKGTLLSELKDSGLSYNPKTNSLTSFQGSKFAPEEVSMLDKYVKDVQALGDTPSVSQIDNFISKTRSDLNFAKGKSGVIGTTNAERIIKGNLNGMRESLNPSKNGLPQLSKYWNANKAYSDLSDFIEEGAGFLGKTTQSGDFAKDASVAKSSVQSILNGGKKDWLIKLEGLTGYPALDESVLALQAMKDAGDFKGLSLLQAMQESGGIPTSKAGFTQKILDMAVARGEKLIVGTPEEQTRALLQDLSVKNSTKASIPIAPTISKPTGGQSTQSIKSSSESVIPTQSTPTPIKGKGIKLNAGFADLGEIKKAITPRNESNMSKKAVDAIAKSPKIDIPEEVIAKANKFTPKQVNMTELFLSDPKNSAYNEDFRKMIGYEGFNSGMSQQKLEVLASQIKESIGLNIKTKVFPNLEQEAKKYKSGYDFYQTMPNSLRDSLREKGIRGEEAVTKYWEDATGLKNSDSYQMSHRPTESGAIASDITLNGEFIPKDAYQHPEWYFNMTDKSDYGVATRESWGVIQKLKGKPEATVTIYRASPSKDLNNGDWVTLSKKYAEIHAKDSMPIHSFKVKAKEIQFAGDDINEFGYFPKK